MNRRQKNREAQARWRERHIKQRRNAQRIANLLIRRKWPDGTIEELAGLLGMFLTREGARSLRRELRKLKDPGPKEEKENAAYWRENEKGFRDWWLREHPGRTRSEYNRLLRDDDSEVWEWRRAKGKASIAAERATWERDHPGQQWQEHMCGMTDREYTDYQRWGRQRERRRARRNAGKRGG
jgi:hypothetical protein